MTSAQFALESSDCRPVRRSAQLIAYSAAEDSRPGSSSDERRQSHRGDAVASPQLQALELALAIVVWKHAINATAPPRVAYSGPRLRGRQPRQRTLAIAPEPSAGRSDEPPARRRPPAKLPTSDSWSSKTIALAGAGGSSILGSVICSGAGSTPSGFAVRAALAPACSSSPAPRLPAVDGVGRQKACRAQGADAKERLGRVA